MSTNNKIYLITGGKGLLARAFDRELERRGATYYCLAHDDLDLTDEENVADVLAHMKPAYVLNCAGYNRVEEAEKERDHAMRVNADAVGFLAKLCHFHKIKLVHFSTDYVFNGNKQGFYNESDAPDPLSVYAVSKWSAEQQIYKSQCDYLILRVSWLFGRGETGFLHKVQQWAKERPVLKINADQVSVPSYTNDVADVTLKALEQDLSGLYHACSSGYATRYEMTKLFAELTGLKNLVMPVPSASIESEAVRPTFAAMSNAKIAEALGIAIPRWEDGMRRFAEELKKG